MLKLLTEKGYSREKTNMLLEFTGRMIRLKDEKLNRKFNQVQQQITGRRTPMGMRELVMEELRGEGLKQGIEQGIEQGRKEKDLAFVQNLLLKTDFTDERIASLTGISIAFVKKVKTNLAIEK